MTTPLPVLPQIIAEAGLVPDSPVQGNTVLRLDDVTFGKLDTATLGTAITWTDISQWVISFTVTRPSTRQQGPLFTFQAGTASILLDNSDGRFDPDNLAGPYVSAGLTQLTAMVPVRLRAAFAPAAYALYSGFADGWLPGQVTYEGGYAEITLPATDAFKVLAGITLAAVALEGAGADSGARVRDILGRAGWYTSADRTTVGAGNSTLQGTTLGDTALNLMQVAADSEIGQLYVNGSGAVTFRPRRDLLTAARSNTAQAVFGDLPGTLHFPGQRPSSQGNSFEGGANGVWITPAGSGGVSGQPFAAVTGGGAVAFSTAQAAHGTLSARCATTASPSVASMSYATGSHPQLWARFCLFLTASPAVPDNLLQFTDAGGAQLAGALVSITGQLGLVNRFGSSSGVFATTLPLNQWVMVTLTATFPQASTAMMTAALYLSPDGSPVETVTISGQDFGTTPVANAVFGPSAGVASNFIAYLDDVEVNNDGPSGPPGLAPLPELAYAAVARASDDTTIANDVQATIAGHTAVQEVQDAASISKYLFPRTYARADLILQNDSDALNWAQWVLYVSKGGEDRFESLAVDPAADPYNLWPQVLGRETGDRVQVWQRPAGVAAPVVKDCFIAGITHAWDSVTSAWLTTWTLQDASKYGSFLTLNNTSLGQLDHNALTFLGGSLPIPTWSVGQVLAAADVNNWFIPVAAVRTSTQSVTSSTVLVNDTQLLVPVAANATYHFMAYIFYEGGTQGSSDIKFGYSVPAGTTMRYHRIYASTAGTAINISTLTETDVQGAGTQGAGIACGMTHHGTIVTSATTGNVQFQWAQSTSSATATQVLAQSAIVLRRIG